MIKNTLLDYITIRISIAALRLIAPTSIAYLAFCALKPTYFFTPVALVATVEAAFYVFVYLPRRSRLQAPPTHPPPTLTAAQRRVVFDKCVESAMGDTSTDAPYPSSWFLPKNSTLKREDAIDWLLWALFSASREEIDVEQYKDELDGYLKGIEELLGKKLDPGHSRDDGVRGMRVTLDPVVMLHRPLVWYLIVAFVDSYTSIALACMGFKHYSPRESQWSRSFPPRPVLSLLSRRAPEGAVCPYWYRPHKSTTKLPVVFLHGVGIGLYPYIPFIRSILEEDDTDVGILLPELLSICMHMTPRSVPPRPQMLESLNIVLDSLTAQEHTDAKQHYTQPDMPEEDTTMQSPLLGEQRAEGQSAMQQTSGWNKVVLIGHSYGTFVAGWIIRQCVDTDTLFRAPGPASCPANPGITPADSLAAKIAHVILVDPIPILISNPTVAHNFLYRHPSTVCPRRLGSACDFGVEFAPVAAVDVDVEAALTSGSAPHPLSSPSCRVKHLSSSPMWYSSASAWQLWYFASQDADIARTLFRTFFWTEGGIWREEIGAFMRGCIDLIAHEPSHPLAANAISGGSMRGKRRMAVVLGGHDQVVPSEAIRRYLTREERWKARWVGRIQVDGRASEMSEREGELEVLFNPWLDHAVIFDDEKWTEPLVDVVRRYVRDV